MKAAKNVRFLSHNRLSGNKMTAFTSKREALIWTILTEKGSNKIKQKVLKYGALKIEE